MCAHACMCVPARTCACVRVCVRVRVYVCVRTSGYFFVMGVHVCACILCALGQVSEGVIVYALACNGFAFT